MALKNSVISDFVAKTSSRNIDSNKYEVHDILEEQNVHEGHDIHEMLDEHDVDEVLKIQDIPDEHEVYEEKITKNSLDKPIIQNEHEVYDNKVIQTIAKLVNEAQKVQQVYDVYDKHDIQEVQYAQSYETTRGRKGKKLHRMNTGYTEPNWEFLVKESRQQGLRGGATELINMIIDEYRIKKK